MGIFDFFKSKKNKFTNTENGILGPTYLEGLTIHIENPKNLQPFEWRRKLKSLSGETKFKIKYYGKLHNKYPSLIVQTDFAPALVLAFEPETGQEIVLFDGYRHGYNAMLVNNDHQNTSENRIADKYYIDTSGNDTFEVIISIYYQMYFEDEFAEDIDENGMIELIDGKKITLDELKRNAFDVLNIMLVNNEGKEIEIISEELA